MSDDLNDFVSKIANEPIAIVRLYKFAYGQRTFEFARTATPQSVPPGLYEVVPSEDEGEDDEDTPMYLKPTKVEAHLPTKVEAHLPTMYLLIAECDEHHVPMLLTTDLQRAEGTVESLRIDPEYAVIEGQAKGLIEGAKGLWKFNKLRKLIIYRVGFPGTDWSEITDIVSSTEVFHPPDEGEEWKTTE